MFIFILNDTFVVGFPPGCKIIQSFLLQNYLLRSDVKCRNHHSRGLPVLKDENY